MNEKRRIHYIVGCWLKNISNDLVVRTIPFLKTVKIKGKGLKNYLWKFFFLSLLLSAILVDYFPEIFCLPAVLLVLCYFDKVIYIVAVIFDIVSLLFLNLNEIWNGIGVFTCMIVLVIFIMYESFEISEFLTDIISLYDPVKNSTFLHDIVWMLISISLCFVAFLIQNSIFIKYFYNKIVFYLLYVFFAFLTSVAVFFALGVSDTIVNYVEQYIATSYGKSLEIYLHSITSFSIKDIVTLLGYYFSSVLIAFTSTIKIAEKYIDTDEWKKIRENMKE